LGDLARAARAIERIQKANGLDFPWASSFGSDFNFDFNVSFTEEQQRKGIEYNYRREPPMESAAKRPSCRARLPRDRSEFAAASGTDVDTTRASVPA
jgi:predicted dithiol-disulfide oxidoreductase (DUF899 family)